jgi:hemolysin III
LPRQRAKALFRKLDHGAIYLMIAGTYTPFTLGALNGPWGWTLFGLVWGLAAVGVTLRAFDRLEHPLASLALYLLMGWLCMIAIGPLFDRVPRDGLILLAAGGAAYMAGVGFFAADTRVRYAHFVWHLFVLAGTACHFFAVMSYAA